MKHAILSTIYKHHSSEGGYHQLAKFTKPDYIFGSNELTGGSFLDKYKWLHEFNLAINAKNIDLIHIYYAEEYYRFLSYLKPNTPIVATFHQPPSVLKEELEKGNRMGRVYGFTHKLTKSRFKKIDAAIILHENQRTILEKYIPSDRIHYIPHGLYPSSNNYNIKRDNTVLTVGNWLRDWDLYENIICIAEDSIPNVRFELINRSIENKIIERLTKYKNFKWLNNISDDELKSKYSTSSCIFLPVTELTANNAVNEALIHNCPIIVNKQLFSTQYRDIYQTNDIQEIIKTIALLVDTNIVVDYCEILNILNWDSIAKRTKELYYKVII